MKNCIFCKIISQELPAKIIYQTDSLIVIEDKFPRADIHYLIIPKNHIEKLTDLEEADACIFQELVFMAKKISQSNSRTKDFKFIINNGYNAGQRVFHLHAHFLAGANLAELV